ncbi:NUDIX hydrolase [Pseudoxanthomonas sp. UTMC 1351]|uniref:NUDIX hydrolase n=1 Tax=Pseudoxanthomonas sp. UTMC 1351 TaxID=2695853 RepID=UPI0034CF882B
MQLIATLVHPDLKSTDGNVLRRHAVRGIVTRGSSILLLYTERYNDFSFPGGGLDPGEDRVAGLAREMQEETGARNVKVVAEYGYIEEFRPFWKPEFDLMHMTSHFFSCEIDQDLGEIQMESYELDNGMRPVWVDIGEAVAHNKAVMAGKEKSMGLSIYRETFMLERIAGDLLALPA